ncbi:bacterio-opsin activator domain-containing protein [Haloarchaeobius litoreus]|uniref:Bacterio-opsin activator domain-containing protein n=1 Tax=Haloarchaeobius litoreus TaxID=755306 RepID=A0ABD6DGN7_9EURY|nr:bacterio-opsin activator domain-containing protein [Haloarchaeobius litoreus]
METVAEVRLSHDGFVLAETIAAHPNLTVQLTAQAPTPEGDWLLFLTAAGDDAGPLLEALHDDPTVTEPCALSETLDHCVYRVRIVDGIRVSGVLGDPADELDISRRAASERLRRAVGSLLEETF